MFQIVVAYVHSLDMGTDCLFNENNATIIHRPISTYKDNIMRNVGFTNEDIITIDTYSEHLYGFNYNELPNSVDLSMDGYFQTEKYFKHRRESVLKLFEPRERDIDYITDKYGDLNDTCSIHVRRGDYVNNQTHHPTCSLGYYRESINFISNNTPSDIKFLVFSDDIEWCKQNFIGEPYIFVENELDYIDLYLMSMCSNNIIANSTFSWWGAWLNKNENKVVIAPKHWFGSAKHLNTTDLLPKNWNLL